MAEQTAQEEVTRVPKKRAASKVATKKVATKKAVDKPVAVKRVAAKRVPRRTVDEVEAAPVRRIPKSTRKAPTTIPERGPAKHFPFAVTLSIGAFVVAFGTSAIVGFQGNGAIDVAQVIEARAQRVSQQGEGSEAEASAVAAAASNATSPSSNTPNGGLRGSGADAPASSEPGPVAVDESEQITFVDAASSTEPTPEEVPSETPPEEQPATDTAAEATPEEPPADVTEGE